jgi:thiol-disulfide isomerase/thioredoxin
MKFLLFTFMLAYSATVSAQDSLYCHIELSIKSKQLSSIAMNRWGLSSSAADKREITIKPLKGYQRIAIPREGLYKIDDGFAGHTIFIAKGDSVKMAMIEKSKGMDDGTFQFHKLNVFTKHSGNYTFYDELRTRYHMSKRKKNESPMHYKERCDSILLVGNNLLQEYNREGIITPRFRQLAEEELKALYVGWFVCILSDFDFDSDNLPQNFYSNIRNLKFTNNTYAIEGNEYKQAAYLMNIYINNRFSSGYSDSVLRRDFKSIVNTYSGPLRDKLMSWHIEDYAEHNTSSFDSIYHVFQNLCQSPYIKRACLNKIEKVRADMKKTDNLSLIDALDKSFVVDVKGKRRSITSTIADTIPTIIDCWATWCGPCLEQTPFIHAIEKRYKGKVRVIYISLDEKGAKWLDFLRSKKLMAGNTYRIVDADSTPFLPAMRIKTIPRFILIRKGDADVLNAWMPMPSDAKQFEQALKPYVR